MTPAQPALAQPLELLRPETVLSYDDVLALEGISRRELFNRIRDGQYETAPSGKVGRNGRPLMLVRLDTLSAAGQALYLAQVRDRADGFAVAGGAQPLASAGQAPPGLSLSNGSAVVLSPASTDRLRGAAVPMLHDGTPDVAAMRHAGRDAEADQYLQRISAISRALAALDAARHGDIGLTWARLEVELATPAETLRRWMRSYRTGGAASLVPGYGANRGHYHRIPDPLQRAIKSSWRTQQRQSVAQIMRHTVRPWCASHGHLAPNRTTVARFIRAEVVAAENAAFRIGRRGWEEDIMAKVARDPETLAVNDLWCADHRKMDTFVLGPDGRVIRPWLTLYVDIASASFAGWCLRDRPNSQSVALALRSGIIRRGAPQVLYHDNGKEFVAKRFGGKARTRLQMQNPQEVEFDSLTRWPALPPTAIESQYGQSLLATYGIERIINAIPYSSWSKPIESMFGAFARAWENIMPGWCGHSTDTKPAKLVTELRDHRLLTWDQYVEIFRKHVEEWESNHVCGTRSRTPDQYYAAARTEIRSVPVEALDLLMLRAVRKKVETQGIEVGGRRFLDQQLAFYVGEYVEVLWDPDDLSAIIVRPARNPNIRLAVAPIPDAGWFEFSEANRTVLSIRKAQRGQIRAVAVEDSAHRNPDHVDPDGANRLALGNAADYKALSDPAKAGESNGPLSLLKSAAAADRAESKAAANSRKSHAAAVATRIAAQARSEESYQKGEDAPQPA